MKNTTINHSRLKEFCDTILMQAREVLYDREEDILKAWHENIEEAQQSEKKFPPLKLALGATVNLEEGTIETTLRFTAVYQSSISAELPDPNQPELPSLAKAVQKFHQDMKQAGASVSIFTPGETVYDAAEDEADPMDEVDDVDVDGPAIVDAVEPLADYDIQQLLMDLEKAPKLQRRNRLGEMLEKHGPDLIHQFAQYATWNDPDKHLVKVIEMRAANLAIIDKLADEQETQPEGSADY